MRFADPASASRKISRGCSRAPRAISRPDRRTTLSRAPARVGAMIILSHPTGNENVRQTALAFAEANLLEQFFITINWNPGSAFDRILPQRLRESFRRRSFPEVVRHRARSHPTREAMRLFFGAMHLPLWSEHERGYLSIEAISAALDRAVAAEVGKNGRCKLV